MPERSLHVRAFFGGLLLSVAVLPEALVALGIGFGLWHLFRFIDGRLRSPPPLIQRNKEKAPPKWLFCSNPCVRCSVTRDTSMVTKTHFPFPDRRLGRARATAFMQHVAGVDAFGTAVATYWAACRRSPKAKITLGQEARIIEKSRKD